MFMLSLKLLVIEFMIILNICMVFVVIFVSMVICCNFVDLGCMFINLIVVDEVYEWFVLLFSNVLNLNLLIFIMIIG